MDVDKMVRKIFKAVAEKADDGLVAVISTGAVDRDGDVLVPNGVVLDNYLGKNSVVLWAHEHDIPAIGKAQWVKATRRDIRAKIEWARTAFAQEIRLLYEDGILNAFSVGFIPLEYEEITDKNGNRTGYRFTKWELLEFSAVNVPANQEALTVRAKGLSTETRAALGIPEVKGVIPYKEFPLDPEDAEWDAAVEVRAADIEDLKVMCMWYDAENEDVKSAYKLPHHRAGNYHTVWRAVAASMGALLGARGGVDIPDADRAGVYRHAAKHYRDFDKTPPEFRSYDFGELVDLHLEGKILLPYTWVERLAETETASVETLADDAGMTSTESAYGEAVQEVRTVFSDLAREAELRKIVREAVKQTDKE